VNSVAIGAQALFTATEMNNVVAIGPSTFYYLTTGVNGVAIGNQALGHCTSGNRNTAIGAQALVATTTGDDNTAVGAYCLDVNTTGSRNTGVGMNAGYTQETGDDNVFVGALAGRGQEPDPYSASRSTVVGSLAFRDPGIDANDNSLIGFRSGFAIETGEGNTALGSEAGSAITTGSRNIAIGRLAQVDDPGADDQINLGDRYFHDRIRLLQRIGDPPQPTEGNCVVWMSDGSGRGDAGDVLIAATVGGLTTWTTLFDHSAGNAW
jgi:hypothetical protein